MIEKTKNLLSFFKSNSFRTTVAVIILIQLLVAFQGFDVCDDGFVMTFYQQFFNAPESVSYNFLYYSSGILGGLWYELYPNGGIFWFRILGIIINTACFITAYKILKSHIPKGYLFCGLTIVLFINNFGFLSFYHNHLTALLCLIIIFLLKKGFETHQLNFFFLAGILIGVNSLVRLPNFAFWSILLVIIFDYFINKKRYKQLLSYLSFSILGIITGLGLLLMFMLVFDHLEIMKQSLSILFDLGNTEGSAHNFKDVIMAQYYNYIEITLATISVIIFIIIFFKIFDVSRNSRFTHFISILVSIVAVIFWIYQFEIYAVYALGIMACLSIILLKKNGEILRLIGFMGMVTMFIIPLGTGGGVKNAGYIAIWIGLPLFFLFLNNFSEILNSFLKIKLNFKSHSQFTIYTIFIVAFLLYKSFRIFNEAYFDKGSRLNKTEAINNKLARYIYTTKERADVINPILNSLKKYTKEGDHLLVYDHLPMLHFLTKTKPYTQNPWPKIYDYKNFELKLKQAEENISEKPVVVQQKFYAIHEFSEPVDDYLSEERPESIHYSIEATKVMNDFLERHQYEIVWQNEYFNIYKSNL